VGAVGLLLVVCGDMLLEACTRRLYQVVESQLRRQLHWHLANVMAPGRVAANCATSVVVMLCRAMEKIGGITIAEIPVVLVGFTSGRVSSV